MITHRAISRRQEVILRDADKLELALAGYTNANEGLNDSIERSWQAFEVCINEKPVAYWGHRPYTVLSGEGHAWMLSTPEIENWKLYAAAASRQIVNELMTVYSSVLAIADPQYELALKWLHWLRFSQVDAIGPFVILKRTR